MRNWARTLIGRARPTSPAPGIPPAPPAPVPEIASASEIAPAAEIAPVPQIAPAADIAPPPPVPAADIAPPPSVPASEIVLVPETVPASEIVLAPPAGPVSEPATSSEPATPATPDGPDDPPGRPVPWEAPAAPPGATAGADAVWPAGRPMPARVVADGPGVGWAGSVPAAAVLRERLDGALRVAAVLRADVWKSRYRPRRPPNASAYRDSLAELVALMRQLLAVDGLSLAPLDNLVMFHQRTNEFAGGAVWPAALDDHVKATEVITYCEQCAALLRALLLALVPPRTRPSQRRAAE
ncbi:MAG: hypothetical protein V7637_5521 [Mycobacteriales bacterium]